MHFGTTDIATDIRSHRQRRENVYKDPPAWKQLLAGLAASAGLLALGLWWGGLI